MRRVLPARTLRCRQMTLMPETSRHFDFIVMGSGFGCSRAAHRLTEKGYGVAGMEMGRRWATENLPGRSWQIWCGIWRPHLALRGLFNMRPFRHVMILPGCAVGGGSITYWSTSLAPQNSIWNTGRFVGGPGGLEERDAAPE
jgi:cholesterol oxidase